MSAQNTGGGVGQAGIAGRIAAAGGASIGAAPGGLFPTDSPPDLSMTTDGTDWVVDLGMNFTPNRPPGSGSTTQVANTGPTAGTTPTATPSPLPGPTGGTTPTASRPGDPPDAKPPLTQEQHQKLVDTAKSLDQAWRNEDAQIHKLNEIISKNQSGTATENEKKTFNDAGGVSGIENLQKEHQAKSRDYFNKYQEAQKQAQDNHSYRHVR